MVCESADEGAGCSRRCITRLVAAVAALLANRLEAVGAVHRLVVPRNEGDHGVLAAVAADRRVHRALRAGAVAGVAAVAAPAGRLGRPAARRPAPGLVGAALLSVDLLLTGGAHELGAAVAAGQGLVCEAHLVEISLVSLCRPVGGAPVLGEAQVFS